MVIDLVKYLTVSMTVFIFGICGIILNRKNIIISSGSRPTTINIPGKEHILLSQDVETALPN